MIKTCKTFSSNLALDATIILSEKHIESIQLKAASKAAFSCLIFSPIENGYLIDSIFNWFANYLLGKPQKNNLPINLSLLSPFAKKVTEVLLQSSPARKFSYKSLAEKADSPNAYRAAGSACHKNPFVLYVPCHRVIAKNGKIGGYALGQSMKKKLLDFELAVF
ncbi:MAG: hypothetical protein COT84_00265 [Chlamydiae bacterium CG10_big_fil_rev_8_21_14_0_10_35_9]|nr:MAG: hypothetical protein COT84_00265 [Chlamydiae bacterium CG10_big_fil_rev_8_21_14_0_10_35_9]